MDFRKLIDAELNAADAINELATRENRPMTADERSAYTTHLDKAEELEAQRTLDERAKTLRSRQATAVQAQADAQRARENAPSGPTPNPTERSADEPGSVVVHGSPVYRKEDPRLSYFRDLRDAKVNDDQEARERLRRHSEWEREQRTMSSSDGEGGELIAPVFLQLDLIERRAYTAVVASLLNQIPLPPHTDSISIPKITTAATIGDTTENEDLPDGEVGTDKVSASVVRKGGKVPVPNTLLDRSMPGVDQIVMRDLAKEAAIELDNYVIAALLAAATSVRSYTAGSFTFAAFWPLFQGLVQDVNNAAKVDPSAVVGAPRRVSYLRSLLDSAGRPLLGGINAQNSPGLPGRVAQGLAGELDGYPMYKDGNIGKTYGVGTNEDKLLVAAFDESWLFSGDPRFAASVDARFEQDSTVFRVTQDMAVIADRYPGSIGVLQGTAMSTSL